MNTLNQEKLAAMVQDSIHNDFPYVVRTISIPLSIAEGYNFNVSFRKNTDGEITVLTIEVRHGDKEAAHQFTREELGRMTPFAQEYAIRMAVKDLVIAVWDEVKKQGVV